MSITKTQICEILRKVGVPYFTSGKNVSEDSVNINCVFCNDDPSDHLGIFQGDGVFSCWRCKRKGPLVFLLKVITGFSEEQCQDIIDGSIESADLSRKDPIDVIEEIIRGNTDGLTRKPKKHGITRLPEFFEPVTELTISPLLSSYLTRRKITKTTLIDHSCGICRVGNFMSRMVIPVMLNGEVVAFQAADMTGMSNLKYKTEGDINDYLYNYDRLGGERIIVTEGILDVWRIGADATCTFGTHMTDLQMRLILDKKPKELIFTYDSDYYFEEIKSQSIPYQFAPFVDIVKLVEFPLGHDPDSYGRDFGIDALTDIINTAEEL